MLNLRDYQQKIIGEVNSSFYKKVVIWMPTGAGKTEVATRLALDENGVVLFVVERKTLCRQTVDRIKKYAPTLKVGILQGSNTKLDGDEKIVVASIQTLQARKNDELVKEILSRVTLQIIDECHILYEHHNEVVRFADRVIGLTATPLRAGLGNMFGSLIKGPSYSDLIVNDYLVKPRYFLVDQGVSLQDIEISSTGDYVQSELSDYMSKDTLIADAVKNWIKNGEYRNTIAFCVGKEHSRILSKAFNANGIPSGYVEDKTSESDRKVLFEQLRNGEIKVLCSVGVLSIGFDEPSVSCIILARPTLSLSLHIQQIGRGLRAYPNKDDCLVFDHALNVRKHGKIESFNPPPLNKLHRHSDRKSKHSRDKDYISCPECSALIEGSTCIECNFEIDISNGNELIEVEFSIEDHAKQIYQELLYIAEDRGYAPGWVYHQVKNWTGFIPPKNWIYLPHSIPSFETLNKVHQSNQRFREKKLEEWRQAV